LGPEEREKENGEQASLPIRLGVWESVVSSPSGLRAGRKRFYCNLISADRPLMTADDSSPFHPKKWGYVVPIQKVGVPAGTGLPVPLVPRKLHI